MPIDDMTRQPPLLKPTPRRIAKPVAEEELDAGQVQLKQEMIELCQEMINLLAILAKKERAFDVFQQQLLEAAKQEGWSMTVPAETDVAEPASSSTAKAGGGALLKTSSIPDEASSRTEVPSSPQEHLDALNALNDKINQLNRCGKALPQSVQDILFNLQLQVNRSILAVKKDIAAEKQQAYKAQVAEQREATPSVPSKNLFEGQRELEEAPAEMPKLERRHSF